MSGLMIAKLYSGGVITNYACTSSCAHCLYNCGPYREKEYITYENAVRIFSCIRELGCYSVHIGGGEPFLHAKGLAKLLDAAAKERVAVEYVETNASWFTDPKKTEKRLSDLKKKGLKRLLVSISPYHNAAIEFYKTLGVIQAAQNKWIEVIPWTGDFINDLSLLDHRVPHSLDEYMQAFGENYKITLLSKYWTHLGGRALMSFRNDLARYTADEVLAQHTESCHNELANTSHFHIDLFGNYIPGLCSGLAISMEDLGKPLSGSRYPIITALDKSGILGLYELAGQQAGYTPLRNRYINKCDLCTEIRFFLFQAGWKNELLPEGFYTEPFNSTDTDDTLR